MNNFQEQKAAEQTSKKNTTKTSKIILVVVVGVVVLLMFNRFKSVFESTSCDGVEKFANPFYDQGLSKVMLDWREYSMFGKKDNEIFRINLGGWERDECRKMKNADAQSFQVLNRYYAKDKNNAYVVWQPYNSNLEYTLPGVDTDSFEILNEKDEFSKDKDHVYSHLDAIQGVEARSFELLEGSYARDANRVYHLAELENEKLDNESSFTKIADVKTFQVLSETYAKDKNNVYLNRVGEYPYEFGAVLQGADAATFRVFEKEVCRSANGATYVCKQDFDAEDKNHKYKEGKIVD